MSIINIKDEMVRHTKTAVPPVLAMSIILGLFNASEWTFDIIYPKVALSFSIAVVGCLFGLIALFVGLKITNQMQSMFAGWIAGVGIGLSGIAFMLWYYSTPVN